MHLHTGFHPAGTRARRPFFKNKSGKYNDVPEGIASSGKVDGLTRLIRPLFPTRCLCYDVCAIKHYKTSVDSLLDMSAKTDDTAVKAVVAEWLGRRTP